MILEHNKTMLNRRTAINIDIWLSLAVLFLGVAGIYFAYDAGYAMASKTQNGDGFKFLLNQAKFLIVGYAAMFGVMRIGIDRLRKWNVGIMGAMLLSLVLVRIPALSSPITDNNGKAIAYRSFKKIMSFSLQPSEFAKIAIILYLASWLSNKFKNVPDKRAIFGLADFKAIIPPLLVIIAAVFFVLIEPDMGTAIIVFLIGISMLFFGGAKEGVVAAIFTVFFVLGLAFSMTGFRKDRIIAFLHPNAYGRTISFHNKQGLMAVGSGSKFGMGFTKGRIKHMIPEANEDYVFATIAEETGFIGSITIMSLLAVVVWRAKEIALNAVNQFHKLVAAGVGCYIGVQALINIACVTNSIPETGVPLPFLSYGGNSLISVMIAIGLLMSISNSQKAQKWSNSPIL